MRHRALVLLLTGCVACASPVVVSPSPELCRPWTLAQVGEYVAMQEGGDYPEVAQLVTDWNGTCAANAAIVSEPWLPPVWIEKAKPFWRFW